MQSNDGVMVYSRREFGKLTLAGLPLSLALAQTRARIDSRVRGVLIGAQSYSFRSIPNAEDIIKAMVKIGLGEVELMSNHAEALAGAPAASSDGAGRGRGRGEMTPEEKTAAQAAQRARDEELRKWRTSTSMDKFKEVRKKLDDAGIELRVLCYNMSRSITDDQIEYGFQMAKALGVGVISTSTAVSVAKRVAPFADKHQIMVGYHNHSNLKDPEEVATPESFAACTSFSKYHGINLDIGHFTAANFDPVQYLDANHARITNLHLKDRKRDQGPTVPWGQGDTPIKPVLELMRDKKYDIPANIEYEYEGTDAVSEVAKCFQYCKDALA
jgi:sugar phosphate isomerase/epimerase